MLALGYFSWRVAMTTDKGEVQIGMTTQKTNTLMFQDNMHVYNLQRLERPSRNLFTVARNYVVIFVGPPRPS